MNSTVAVSAEHADPSTTGALTSLSAGRQNNLLPLDYNLESNQPSPIDRESWGSIEKKSFDEAVEELEAQLEGKDLEWLTSIAKAGNDPSSILCDLLVEAQKQRVDIQPCHGIGEACDEGCQTAFAKHHALWQCA